MQGHLYCKPPKLIGGYLFGRVLGEGSYGKVKEVVCERSLTRRAVKIVKLQRLRKIPGGWASVQGEMRLLRRLRHPNVVRLYSVMHVPEKEKWWVIERALGVSSFFSGEMRRGIQ